MDTCCIAVDDVGPSPIVESCPASPLFDSVARWEFEAAIHRLETRLQQLEQHLHTAHADPKEVTEGAQLAEWLDPSGPQVTNAICNELEKGKDHQDEFDDVIEFGESVWSLPLVLDFKRYPLWDGIFSLLLLFLNLAMQAMFSGILLSDDFAGDGMNVEEERANARRWRLSVAHDFRYMDLSERSLVTRVCQSDGALILSTPQAELINQINSFLGLGADSFEPGVLRTGILLCLLCILHWSSCVYKEFRSIWLAFEAVLGIPRASNTIIAENRIDSLSMPRLLFVLATLVLRAVIAGILLVAGIRWLGRTTSITELMLNAVALNGIMDVDELLFAGCTPLSVQQAIKKLEPIKMKYSRVRSQTESLALFFLLAATMLVPYLVFLEPLGAGMVEIKKEMCAGNQTFVVADNPEVQEIIGYRTQAFNGQELKLIEIAVEHHRFQEDGPPQYIFFAASRKLFDRYRTDGMSEATERSPFCLETDSLRPGSRFHNDPVITPILQGRLRSAMISLGQPASTTCDEGSHLCNRPDARALRLMCGDTCGCTDPYSSPWYKVKAQGCADSCTARIEIALAEQPCEDQPIGEVWNEFWDGYATALSAFYGQNASQVAIWPLADSVSGNLRSAGCNGLLVPELQMEVVTQAPFCQGQDSLFRPLAWICPRSCGCVEAAHPYCPLNCRNTTAP